MRADVVRAAEFPDHRDLGDGPARARTARATSGLERARRVTRWLDGRYLDPILGFVMPGVGDVVASGAGLYLLWVAVQHRLPPVVIARMLLNLALDAAIGAIPLVGDLFDVAFKANRRNLALLEERVATGRGSSPADWGVMIAAFAVFVGALALPIWLAIEAYQHLF